MTRTEKIAVAIYALVAVAGVGAVKWSCEVRAECLGSRCASGLKPVWLHRDATCICAEVPE